MTASLRILHLYPELLNLYGDSGNILVLTQRLRWRHIPVEVCEVHVGERPSLHDADLVFIGGGSDREQRIVCESLQRQKHELKSFVEDGGALLAVCGGYQLLGEYYMMGPEKIAGLELVDLRTDRGSPRLISNIIVESRICTHNIVGYENHGGRTSLGAGVEPLGRVIYGKGNDGVSGFEGCLYNNVVGTYIHGPLLPKNPGVADFLLERALEQRGITAALEPLDDSIELEANRIMCERLLRGEVKETR